MAIQCSEAADAEWAASSSSASSPRLVWSRPNVTERPAQPEDEIERLALLDTFEYERVRDDEAKRLKVRVSVLDEHVSKRRKAEKEVRKGQASWHLRCRGLIQSNAPNF